MRSSQRANLQAIRPLGVRGVPTGRAHEQGERVEVSVVVPARDEEQTIGPLTEALGRELTAQLAERGWQGGLRDRHRRRRLARRDLGRDRARG